MTLRELLKEKGIAYKVVSDALGIHPNNMPRYDDLMKRSVEEVITISNATGIQLSELIGLSMKLPQEGKCHDAVPDTTDRLLSIIESQQRAIETQASTIEAISRK